MNRRARTRWLPFAVPILSTVGAFAQVDDRPSIASVDELPAATYELESPVDRFLASDAEVERFAGAVLDDLEDVLTDYDVTDPGLRRDLRRAALVAALLAGRWESATAQLEAARALEEREDLRAVAGLHWEAWIQAQHDVAAGAPSLTDALAARLRERTAALDWSLVHRELKRRHARTGFLGEGLLRQALSSALGPAVEGGTIAAATAHEILPLVAGLRIYLPIKDTVATVYGEFLAENDRTLEDVWTARQVALDPSAGLRSVRIAVWDTGVDAEALAAWIWTNPNETVDGHDDDGNGYVDDVHGIAFDAHLRPTTELLCAPDPDEEVWQRARSYGRGLSDMGASIDSPSARRLQRRLRRLAEDEVQAFLEELMHFAHYSHGTHVAGIAVEGNPFAELVVARVGLDHRVPGERMTLAWAHRFAAMCLDTVGYFAAHDVRVVNMSWGFGVSEIEQNLRDTGAPGTRAEQRTRAEAIHTVLADGIEAALRSAPEILFVCGAGNSGKDSSRDRFAPSSFRLPNLVTVGGVDRAGGMAAFTSFGDHVSLYANGFMVESYLPGGDRVPMSGTSMSSPQVANLAAKLLAHEPSLTPTALIEALFAGADPMRFAGRQVFLLNPRASLERIAGR